MKFLFEGGFLRRIAAAALVFFIGAEAFGDNANIGGNEVKVVSSVEEVKPAFGGNGVSPVFGSDDNYAMYPAAALRSLIDNSNRNRNCDVRIPDGGISEDKRKVIFNLPRGGGMTTFLSGICRFAQTGYNARTA